MLVVGLLIVISIMVIFFVGKNSLPNETDRKLSEGLTNGDFKREEKLVMQQVAISKYSSDEFQAGMNLLIYGHPDLLEARWMFTHLRELGVNSVAITFPFYQRDWEANEVMINPAITPTIIELQGLIEEAHAVGLSVMLRPILDEESLVTSNVWRGQIKPTDADAWFESYQSLLLTYAELAELTDVKVLNIGTELNSLQTHHTDQWKKLIKTIRQVYQGELIYSFNWDTVRDIPQSEFTELLDHVGIDAYFPLNTANGASVEILETVWHATLHEIKEFLQHESIIITEAGIIPIAGAYRTPYSWNIPNGQLDWEAQANYYEATFQVWKPYIQGIYWWTVTLTDDPGEINYSPLHSPTESVIKRHFRNQMNNE